MAPFRLRRRHVVVRSGRGHQRRGHEARGESALRVRGVRACPRHATRTRAVSLSPCRAAAGFGCTRAGSSPRSGVSAFGAAGFDFLVELQSASNDARYSRAPPAGGTAVLCAHLRMSVECKVSPQKIDHCSALRARCPDGITIPQSGLARAQGRAWSGRGGAQKTGWAAHPTSARSNQAAAMVPVGSVGQRCKSDHCALVAANAL